MIRVIASIELAPGQREEFLRVFQALVPKVRAEAGCLEYGPTVDLPTTIGAQIPLRADVVTIVEVWQDLPALEAHLQAPHMAEYRVQVKNLVRKVTLQVLQPA
jgi:quinol monooxygenase YgiN